MEPGGTSSQATHRSRRPRGRRWNEERHAEWSREVPRLRPPTDRAGPGDAGGMKSDMRNGAGRYLVSGHPPIGGWPETDRKSTRLNSSHLVISYAVFCLKKKI